MKRDVDLFIDDILENIELIENSTKKLSKSKFKSNKDIVDATFRRLEVMGEAVKNLPKSFTKKHLGIPWREIAGFRDVLIHRYFSVDWDIVWDVIMNEIPVLKSKLILLL